MTGKPLSLCMTGRRKATRGAAVAVPALRNSHDCESGEVGLARLGSLISTLARPYQQAIMVQPLLRESNSAVPRKIFDAGQLLR